MPYCIYLRKSRADAEAEAGGLSETLARHEKALLDLARSKNLPIEKIYREVVSGDLIAARPVVQELLADTADGKWEGVLVMEVERLARGDTGDQAIISQTFKYSDTLIITPLKTYDPNNEFDEEYFEFGLFMSRREYKTINRRMQRGRTASSQEGKFAGPTPAYGYTRKKLEGEKGWTLEPIPEEAETVRLIYDLYVNGLRRPDGGVTRMGILRIAEHLNALGIHPRRSDRWSSATIREILRNPVYTGKIRWNYRKTQRRMKNGVPYQERNRNRTDILCITDGRHEAIVSQELWEQAKQIVSQHSNPPVTRSSIITNPLCGLVICAKCGRKMVRHSFGNTNYPDVIRCQIRSCENQPTQISLVEQRILDSLRDWSIRYKLQWQDGHSKAAEQFSRQQEMKKKALASIELDLNKVNQQIDRIYDLFEQGIYTTEIFTDRSHKLTASKKALTEKRNNLMAEIEKEQITYTSEAELLPKLEHLLAVYDTLELPEAKNEMLRDVLEKVEYNKTYNGRGKMASDSFDVTIYPRIPKYNW